MRRKPSTAPQAEAKPGARTFSRLRWRCRRGMRELDMLLERYLEERYPCAPVAEQQAFEALLDLPDPDLSAFMLRRAVPADPQWMHVINQLTRLDD